MPTLQEGLEADGYRYLGEGSSRLAMLKGGIVYKFPRNERGVRDNEVEHKVWNSAPDHLRQHLVPVLGLEDGVLLMEYAGACSGLDGDDFLPYDVREELSLLCRRHKGSLFTMDLSSVNISHDGRILDYAGY